MIGYRNGEAIVMCDWCFRVLTPDDHGAFSRREPLRGGMTTDNTSKPGRSAPGPTVQIVHACSEHAAALTAGQFPKSWPRRAVT